MRGRRTGELATNPGLAVRTAALKGRDGQSGNVRAVIG